MSETPRARRSNLHSERKARLLLCAASRFVFPLFRAPEFEELIEAVEGYVDGVVAPAAVENARERAEAAAQRFADDQCLSEMAQAVMRCGYVPRADSLGGYVYSFETFGAFNLMTVICGYLDLWPGRPSSLSGQQVWQVQTDILLPDEATFAQAWRTDDVMMLAAQMYESRSFDPMPILADALQDAECDNDDILSHCRNPQQVHVRGCWVIDLVLAKT